MPSKDTQFKKGQSGNPAGRKKDTEKDKLVKKAKKQFIKDYIEKLSAELPEIEPILVKKAKSGNIVAIKEIHDRVMGKAPQAIEMTGKDGSPLTVLLKEIQGNREPLAKTDDRKRTTKESTEPSMEVE